MKTLLIILGVIASLLLIGIVLIQKSKGGGLLYSGKTDYRRTSAFVEKATWVLACIIVFICIICALLLY